jgi:hypothetical protein
MPKLFDSSAFFYENLNRFCCIYVLMFLCLLILLLCLPTADIFCKNKDIHESL